MNKTKPFKLALIQLAVGDEKKEVRLAHAAAMLDQARGADLIMLPEMWNGGYFAFDRYDADSESMAGETVRLMQKKAAELKAHIMMGSFVEKDAAGLHNTSVLIDPAGKISGSYRKIHLFGFGSDERRLLVPGTEIGTVPTSLGTFGMSTCFDLRFPELYRLLLDAVTKMFLVTSAWPHPRLEAWKILNRARAIENQSFLAAANCAGTNRGKQYCGHSVILDPFGVVIAEAGEEETILRAEIDLSAVDQARNTFPAVQSRVFKSTAR